MNNGQGSLLTFTDFRQGIEEPYNEELVAKYTNLLQTIQTEQDVIEIVASRIQRYLLAYHLNRQRQIADHVLAGKAFGPTARLSPAESELAKTLGKGLQRYSADLPANHGQIRLGRCEPPKDLFIQIRVVRPCPGGIETESGTLYLEPNSFHFVRRASVRGLLENGSVVEIK